MYKKVIIIFSIILFIIISSFVGVKLYRKWQIDHAVIKVELVDNLDIEVYSKVKLKDLIKSINGKLEKNFTIKPTKLGKKEITFNYTNEDNIKVPYTFNINIVDTTKPIISMINSYSLDVGEEVDLAHELFCGDNYDDKPKCTIEGTYDITTPGSYPVTFKATDSSGNTSSFDFTVYVKEKVESTNPSREEEPITTSFQDIIEKHKTSNTKIGIDVSHWQGDIDFKKIKASGVEFAFIRVGSEKGIDGKFYIDEKFKQNIKGFNKEKIPVGIYFYSYANSKEKAIEQAKWIIKQVKKYKIDLPIVFDWESWNMYQEFNLSFYHLTEMANAFIDTVEKAGYNGMLYSSKNYLENIWMDVKNPVWLAHYTEETNYKGNYKFWQLCSNGVVDGINDNMVDIDIMYKEKEK